MSNNATFNQYLAMNGIKQNAALRIALKKAGFSVALCTVVAVSAIAITAQLLGESGRVLSDMVISLAGLIAFATVMAEVYYGLLAMRMRKMLSRPDVRVSRSGRTIIFYAPESSHSDVKVERWDKVLVVPVADLRVVLRNVGNRRFFQEDRRDIIKELMVLCAVI